MDRKVGIIVPYRNRVKHLEEFKKSTTDYLNNKGYTNYVIIIVEQDNAKLFNRGMLLNIGFKEAKKLRCDYVVFHDVDMLPIYVDYSFSEIPLHLATNFDLISGQDGVFDEYFGGVTMFTIQDFICKFNVSSYR